MVMESFNPELTRLGKRRRCIFAEIINSQRTFEIFPFRPTFSPHKARQVRSCQFDLNRDDVGRNDPPMYVCSAWTRVSLDYAAAAGNSKVAGKFVRHVGRRINQAPLISEQGY